MSLLGKIFGEEYIRISKQVQLVDRKDQLMFKVNFVSTILMVALQIASNTVGHETGIDYHLKLSLQEQKDNSLQTSLLQATALMWQISTITRVLILFICLKDKNYYKLLFPVTQILNLAHILIVRRLSSS